MSKALFHILGKNKNYQKVGLAGIGLHSSHLETTYTRNRSRLD